MSQPVASPLEQYTSEHGSLSLVVPAHPEFFLLARMNASGLASMLDFGVDEIEDLKLAVSELCTICLLGATDESRMTLTYRWDLDRIELTCEAGPLQERASGDEASDEQIELAERILAALVDEFEQSPFANGIRKAHMVLRRRVGEEAGG